MKYFDHELERLSRPLAPDAAGALVPDSDAQRRSAVLAREAHSRPGGVAFAPPSPPPSPPPPPPPPLFAGRPPSPITADLALLLPPPPPPPPRDEETALT
jgi:hypothetical protein